MARPNPQTRNPRPRNQGLTLISTLAHLLLAALPLAALPLTVQASAQAHLRLLARRTTDLPNRAAPDALTAPNSPPDRRCLLRPAFSPPAFSLAARLPPDEADQPTLPVPRPRRTGPDVLAPSPPTLNKS